MADTPRVIPDPWRRVRRPLRLTRLSLVAERTARAFWPLWTLALAVYGIWRLGLLEPWPREAIWAFAALAGLGGIAALGYGLWRFRWPAQSEAAQRLDATLPGRPLAALTDTQAIGAGDAASEQVWRAHLGRMLVVLGKARPVAPEIGLARFDPYGLRYAALALVVIALLFGAPLRQGGDGAGLPGGAAAGIAAGPSWEGWVEPPAYTGRPSLYLNDVPPGPLQVPRGTRVELRLYGAEGALTVDESVSGRMVEAMAPNAMAQSFEVTRAGEIGITGTGTDSRWAIALTPDDPPVIAKDGPVRRDVSGEMTQPFVARDDYGVEGGRAVIALDLNEVDRRFGLAVDPEPRDAIEVALPLPIAGDRRDFAEALVEDFSKHPFAGLPVTLMLEAVDAAGQVGVSEPIEMAALPGRRFFHPIAQSMIELRRDLLWSRQNAIRTAQLLRAVSHRPEGFFDAETDYLRMRFIARQLEAAAPTGLGEAERDEIAEALWELALRFEEGDLSDAMAQLRRAQERLAEAIREGATDEEIAELIEELREAMEDYMRQLAEQMQRQGTPQDLADAQELTGQDLQDLLDRLQQLMEEGRMAEAQQLLEQLGRMMENMQMAQNNQGGQPGPGQQALQELQEMLRDQQELSDESFQGLQGQQGQQGQGQQGQGQQGQQGQGNQFGQNQGQGQGNGQMPGQQGQGGDLSLGEQLAERQRALRDELQRQREGLPGAGEDAEDARRSLDDAGRAMQDAEDALRENDLAGAMDSQAEAMDRLRDGIQDLGEELARQQGQPGQPGQGQAAGQPGQTPQRDPLGRETGNNGQLGTRENLLQDEDVYGRARDLLDELRRRSSDQTRPDEELDYLRRLLDRF